MTIITYVIQLIWKTLDHNTFCRYKNSFVYYPARKNVPKISKAYIIYSLDTENVQANVK